MRISMYAHKHGLMRKDRARKSFPPRYREVKHERGVGGMYAADAIFPAGGDGACGREL
jgi:hypothetical protein